VTSNREQSISEPSQDQPIDTSIMNGSNSATDSDQVPMSLTQVDKSIPSNDSPAGSDNTNTTDKSVQNSQSQSQSQTQTQDKQYDPNEDLMRN